TSTCRFSELRLQLINPSTSPNELNTTLTPHSIIHGDACFAYFNKIWGIPPNNPRQHIKTGQSLSARPVRPGGLGGVGQGGAKALGALWAEVVDRSGKEATASQRPCHRARQ